MKAKYRPKTYQQKLGYLVEECGEVLAAAGKMMRWGPDSVNPELPPEEQITNRDWLLRELGDLERGIRLVRELLGAVKGPDGHYAYCGCAHCDLKHSKTSVASNG